MKIFKSQFNKIQTYFFKYFQFPVPVPRLPIKNYLSCVFTSFAVKCFRNKHWFKKSKTAADNKKKSQIRKYRNLFRSNLLQLYRSSHNIVEQNYQKQFLSRQMNYNHLYFKSRHCVNSTLFQGPLYEGSNFRLGNSFQKIHSNFQNYKIHPLLEFRIDNLFFKKHIQDKMIS